MCQRRVFGTHFAAHLLHAPHRNKSNNQPARLISCKRLVTKPHRKKDHFLFKLRKDVTVVTLFDVTNLPQTRICTHQLA